MAINLTLIAVAAVSAWLLLRGYKKDMKESFSRMPANIARWESEITNAAFLSGVPVPIIAAVMWQESRGDARARGSASEVGLMQLKNIAVRDLNQFGYSPRTVATFDPLENVADGAQFLRLQKRRAKDWYNALRAYNAGFAGSQRDSEAGANYARSVLSKAVEFGWNNQNR